jgi:hypothetical protein
MSACEIGWCRGSEAMLEKPPTTREVGKGSVVGMVAEEVAAAVTVRSTSRGSGKGLRQIDVEKAPIMSWPVVGRLGTASTALVA